VLPPGVRRHERKNARLGVRIEPFAQGARGSAEEAEWLAAFIGARLEKLACR